MIFVLRSAYCLSNAVVAFKAFTIVRAFPAQSARLCLIRFAHSQSSCADCPFYRFGKQVAELRLVIQQKSC